MVKLIKMFTQKSSIFGIGALLLLLTSCSSPSTDDVRKDFMERYPKAEIISIYSGEGDSSSVYMHIKYKVLGSEDFKEAVWLYLDNGSSQWELLNREDK